MPRAGLNRAEVVRAAADLADEAGYPNLTLDAVASRLGVRTPSLYKHIGGLPDLRREIAALALRELDSGARDAMHGLSDAAALRAFAGAYRAYIVAHPGRYASTVGLTFTGRDDPLLASSQRVAASIEAVLRGYRIAPADLPHALRTLRSALHGYASLLTSDSFQWAADPAQSFEWMIDFIDRGLRTYAAAEATAAPR